MVSVSSCVAPYELQPIRFGAKSLIQEVKKFFSNIASVFRNPAHDPERYAKIKDLLTPFEVGHAKRRLGNNADGGYVLSEELLNSAQHLYSLGISTDCQIDLELAEAGKKVYQYDKDNCVTPTHPNMRFKQMWVDGESFQKEVKLTGGAERSNNLLLMDIEGGEYDVIFEAATLLPIFSQICLELHAVLTDVKTEQLLESLNLTHTLIHIHANNWVLWPGYTAYTGHPGVLKGLLDLLELTYVRNDTFINKQPWHSKSPTPIDKKTSQTFQRLNLIGGVVESSLEIATNISSTFSSN